MMTQVDLRHPLKSGKEEKDPVSGRMAEGDFPQVSKPLPLDPHPPVGFAPRNAELRLSSAKGSAPLGSPRRSPGSREVFHLKRK